MEREESRLLASCGDTRLPGRRDETEGPRAASSNLRIQVGLSLDPRRRE